uniref:EF-hand domain-containing protein n=1 Tax=Hucho hucho TaxID=62062 RepID=A0A4W5K2I9_9TELE
MFTNCSLGHCHIIIAVVLWSICVDSRKIRGISLSYKRFYRERKSFLCIDGSKMIPFDQVNDDYCDCVDGSDEPGKDARAVDRCHCVDIDCCDASDEYRSQTPCQNTCRNLGQRERAEVEGQMRALGEGLRLKQQLIEEGVLTWREKQAQLRDLQRVSDDLQSQLDDLRKEEARRKEEADALREREIGARETADNSPRSPYRTESPISIFKELDSNRDGSITVDEVQAKLSPVQDEEHALSEDEAVALLGGAHQVDLSRFEETLWTSLRMGDSVTIKGRHGVPGSLADEDPKIKAAVSGKSVRLASPIHHSQNPLHPPRHSKPSCSTDRRQIQDDSSCVGVGVGVGGWLPYSTYSQLPYSRYSQLPYSSYSQLLYSSYSQLPY